MIRRIAVTGPESTGKSRLAAELAAYYNTLWVREYARDYLNTLNRPYTGDDILKIAMTQHDNENVLSEKADKLLFCDTEFLVTKIWSEYCFGSCPEWIAKKFITHKYDLYLLCDIDIPWEPDPLREHPDKGQFFFDWFRNELANNALPYVVINGTGKTRTMNAVNAITAYFPDII